MRIVYVGPFESVELENGRRFIRGRAEDVPEPLGEILTTTRADAFERATEEVRDAARTRK